MFASKTPRDLFPEPGATKDYWWDQRLSDLMYLLASKYVQHNEPNPILVAFRDYEERHTLDTHRLYWLAAVESTIAFGGWRDWEAPKHDFHALALATDAQLDHARRVLERLANLAEPEPWEGCPDGPVSEEELRALIAEDAAR